MVINYTLLRSLEKLDWTKWDNYTENGQKMSKKQDKSELSLNADIRLEDWRFSNLITYSNSSWNVLSDNYESDFRYLHSFTPKNGVKVITKIAIFTNIDVKELVNYDIG